MKQQSDIAIIGISLRMPEASNLQEFYEILNDGKDMVRPIPEIRKKRFSIKKELPISGYLDNIDEFDYKFFNLSLSEAEHMDPHQRMLLQLVCESIEDAGYRLTDFEGTDTALILGAPSSPKAGYFQLIDEFAPTVLTGNLHSFYSGRISHYLDLRGPSIMVDTACSSSLVAVHEACNKIRSGESSIAIAGGLKLFTNVDSRSNNSNFGTESSSGKCKAFDDSADGIGDGEGGGVLILKLLDKALEDNDNIYAVIKGSAVNHDGSSSNGLTAPSPQAQSECIVKAWDKSGVNPETISYIEAHGTGTKLGDPIEFEGLTNAFRKFTDKNKFCGIGSVKTNLGHLSDAAGVAGLLKVIISLKYKKLFPSLHFKKKNAYIDFENTALYVNHTLEDWDTISVRRAGISSFGLSGTNVHMVLEEAPETLLENETGENTNKLITLSAKNKEGLQRYIHQMIMKLRVTDFSLSEISFVLNKGRDDMDYRIAFDAKDIKDALYKFDKSYRNCELLQSVSNRAVIFILSNQTKVNLQKIKSLKEKYSIFREKFDEVISLSSESHQPHIQIFAYQYAMYYLWNSFGVKSVNIIGSGIGNQVIDVILKNVNLTKELLDSIKLEENKILNQEKLKKLVKNFSRQGPIAFVELSEGDEIKSEIDLLNSEFGNIKTYKSFDNQENLLATLYQDGVNINWEDYYSGCKIRKRPLPTYPFEKISVWVEQNENIMNSIEQSDSLEEKIISIWKDVLKVTDIDLTDNYFELGGNSLNGFNMIERLENEFKVTLKFEDILDNPTINHIGEYIRNLSNESSFGSEKKSLSLNERLRTTEEKVSAIWKEVLKIEEIDADADYFDLGGNSLNGISMLERLEKEFNITMDFEQIYDYSNIQKITEYIDFYITNTSKDVKSLPATYSQESMWYLSRLEPESPSYNVPMIFRLKGDMNLSILEECINRIVQRHDSLRTTFSLKGGKLRQNVKKENLNEFDVVDLSGDKRNGFEDYVMSLVEKEITKPFDLEKDALLRVKIFKLDKEDFIFVLCMHHIISDSWSMMVFTKEMFENYSNLALGNNISLPPLSIQYPEFAERQYQEEKSGNWEKQLDFWSNKLSDVSAKPSMPTDYPRPLERSGDGKSCYFTISKELSDRIRVFSRQEKITEFVTLLTGWKTLMYHYSGQKDLIVGTPFAGRQIDTENLIGLFVNTMVLRTEFSSDLNVSTLLNQVYRGVMEAMRSRNVPFNLIVNKLKLNRSTGYNPLFQVMFDFHNAKTVSKDINIGEFKVNMINQQTNTSKCDLAVMLIDVEERFEGEIQYDTDLFKESTIKSVIEDYLVILDFIINNPKASIGDAPLKSMETLSKDDNEQFTF